MRALPRLAAPAAVRHTRTLGVGWLTPGTLRRARLPGRCALGSRASAYVQLHNPPWRNGGEYAWTSPVYLRRATAIRQAQEATDEAVADERARLWEQQLREMRRQQAEAERHEANRAALRERQQQLTPIVLREVAARTEGHTWELPGDPDCAMGVSIIARGERTAVICPVASRITNEVAELLIDLTVYVASDHERRAIARRCRPGQRIVVLAGSDT